MAAETVTRTLHQRKLISPPKFLVKEGCVHYETEVGSVAYGVAQSSSDVDIYGFCIPPKEMIFTHLRGDIPGFGRQKKNFEQYQQHGIRDGEELVWDLTVYSIVRYFGLCMENNPNMLESLFTPDSCVRYASPIAKRIREHRSLFLHKGAWHKFRGFAYSQVHKMKNKEPEGKRVALVEKFGFDVKFAYHAVRLMDEAEQILTGGDLDLQRALWNLHRKRLPLEKLKQKADEYVEAGRWTHDKAQEAMQVIEQERGQTRTVNELGSDGEEVEERESTCPRGLAQQSLPQNSGGESSSCRQGARPSQISGGCTHTL